MVKSLRFVNEFERKNASKIPLNGLQWINVECAVDETKKKEKKLSKIGNENKNIWRPEYKSPSLIN